MRHIVLALAFSLSACGGGGSGGAPSGAQAPSSPPAHASPASSCNGSVASAPSTGSSPAPTVLRPPQGFTVEKIASISSARELAALPNGDLLVGTSGANVVLLPHAEAAGAAGVPVTYAALPESPAGGVTFAADRCTVYVGTQFGVYSTPYRDGDVAAEAMSKIASVRPSGSSDHITTSVAYTAGTVYASVGSSCNACTETDPTRATIQQMAPDGSGMTPKAVHIRNAIALAVNPETGTLWAGVAGQDSLPEGHPYEFFDAVSTRPGVVDYGWPQCEENHVAYVAGADCSSQAVPVVELPAYQTIIGAAFYPPSQGGAYAFPASYRGAFVAAHGSWHSLNGTYVSPPRLVFVAMNGDTPAKAVSWSDPTVQWSDFVTGFQQSDGVTRNARATGVAIGSQGSLFFSDDQNGAVSRVRPQ